jgi:hypothetical protein
MLNLSKHSPFGEVFDKRRLTNSSPPVQAYAPECTGVNQMCHAEFVEAFGALLSLRQAQTDGLFAHRRRLPKVRVTCAEKILIALTPPLVSGCGK